MLDIVRFTKEDKGVAFMRSSLILGAEYTICGM